jgi:hypothetical protein
MEITIRCLEASSGRIIETKEVKSFAAAEDVLFEWAKEENRRIAAEVLIERGFMITAQFVLTPSASLKARVLETLKERLSTKSRNNARQDVIQRLQREIAIVSTAQ